MPQNFTTLADEATLNTTVAALKQNGFTPIVVETLASAKEAALRLVPEGSEVLTSTSKTLDQADITAAINESGKYNAVRDKLMHILTTGGDRNEARKLGAAPDYILGSVHAVTQSGEVVVASATGSQLAPYVSGSAQVIWVVSTQKIVSDLSQAFARIREQIFPLENERAKAAYGVPSSINKELIFHKEGTPGRITIILVKELAGF